MYPVNLTRSGIDGSAFRISNVDSEGRIVSLYTNIRPERKPGIRDVRLKDHRFQASLRGRMDTITAPELLKTWEAVKVSQKITAIAIDCSDLQYVSSAGLRVLLLMYKSSENKDDFRMTGVTDAVREILETTGFHQFLMR